MRGPTGISKQVDSTLRFQPESFRWRRTVMGGAAIAVLLLTSWILYVRFAPFSEASVSQNLSEASDSRVIIGSYQQTYLPSPGCILKNIEFRHGPEAAKFITIDTLTVQGSYIGLLTHHIPRVIATDAHVFIPRFGTGAPFQTQPSETMVNELSVRNAVVEFAEATGRQPLQFEIHEAVLKNVRSGAAIGYQLKFRNPNPPGEISVAGNFGPWPAGHPEQIPLSGSYSFDHADLGVYGGIGGLLSSVGKFEGTLQHVGITGQTEVPDFYVKSGGHRIRLVTHFDAYVDAMHGDTFLNRVDAELGRTRVIAKGSIARSIGSKGKVARLDLAARRGRIEDILGLFVTAPHSPMSGPVAITARVEIPPGSEPFLEKVGLEGTFGVNQGSFSKPDTQRDVNALSAGARGKPNDEKEDPETVMTDLDGRVQLQSGRATFSGLTFSIPGAHARMDGTYDLESHRVNLHGQMRVDTKISKTTSGVKAFLLKVMDPIFKKKKKGEVVPVHILGTYEKPQFGLDMTNSKDQKPAAK